MGFITRIFQRLDYLYVQLYIPTSAFDVWYFIIRNRISRVIYSMPVTRIFTLIS